MKTTFMLMAQYDGKVVIPLDELCRDYFAHLTPTKFVEKVRAGEIKLPLVRLGPGQKAFKCVPLVDFAAYLDRQREEVEALRSSDQLPTSHLLSLESFVTPALIAGLRRVSPHITAVYFLYSGDECVYVGKSKRLHARIREHLGGDQGLPKEFETYSWFECAESDLDQLEARCIAMLRPKFNLTGWEKS